MSKKLFKEFLEDASVYRACEQFWEQLTARAAASVGQTGEWQSWMPRHYANGTPMELDGNPICDGKSQRLDRAYRIIQHAEGFGLGAWLSYCEPEYTELPRHELVISISLSEESARLAEELLRKWMTPETTPEEMAAYLEHMVPDED